MMYFLKLCIEEPVKPEKPGERRELGELWEIEKPREQRKH